MATGHGATFSFGTSAITLPIVSIDPPEESVEDIPQPHLGITKGYNIPYEPGDLVEGDEFNLVLENDQKTAITTRTVEELTWTKPLQSGDTTAANWVFQGYIGSVKETTNETSVRGLIEVRVKVAGNITKNAAT